MEKRNESANDTMLQLTITQQELGVEKNILLKNISVLDDKIATLALKKSLENSNAVLEINLLEKNTYLLTKFLDIINTDECQYIICKDLNEVANIVETSVLDAKKNPHKYADKKVLLNQLYNEEQEPEQEVNYIR